MTNATEEAMMFAIWIGVYALWAAGYSFWVGRGDPPEPGQVLPERIVNPYIVMLMTAWPFILAIALVLAPFFGAYYLGQWSKSFSKQRGFQ